MPFKDGKSFKLQSTIDLLPSCSLAWWQMISDKSGGETWVCPPNAHEEI